MINLKIIEISEENINKNDPSCLMNSFKYMVENEDTGDRWFGSDNIQECEEYILKHNS